MIQKRVAAVVVTYNRLDLLKECLAALLNQSVECDVVLINNNSTDKTEEYIKELSNPKILYYNTGENLGGAGGFAYGIEKAIQMNYDYIWIMDDDSIADRDGLKSLLDKAEKLDNNFSFLCSMVLWTNKKACIMNIPAYDFTSNFNYEFLLKDRLLPIASCSFVGCFVNMRIAEKEALPIKEFFIYGDDIEYTKRLKKHNDAYLDTDSIIIHKTKNNAGTNIVYADQSNLQRYVYAYRNGMYTARQYGAKSVMKRLNKVRKKIGEVLKSKTTYKCKKVVVIITGTIKGMLFNPKLVYVRNRANEN